MSRKSSMERHELELKASHNHIEEAPNVVQIETFRVLGLDPEDASFYNNYSEEKRKKVIRKVRHSFRSCSLDIHD